MRPDYGGGPIKPPGVHPRKFCPASTNGDPRLPTEEVTKQGKVFKGRRVGEEVISPSSSSSSPEDSGSEWISSPCARTVIQASLLSHLLYFCAHRFLLLARLVSHLATSSGRVTHSGSLCTYPGPYTRSHMSYKKKKSTHSEKNKLERTHPGADGSFS
jgi:hypothetical protein